MANSQPLSWCEVDGDLRVGQDSLGHAKVAGVANDDSMTGFVDESMKPVRGMATKGSKGQSYYVVASAVVLTGDISETRKGVLDLRESLGYELHYNDKLLEGRIAMVEGILGLQSWDCYLFETATSFKISKGIERRVRSRALREAFRTLGKDVGLESLVLETRSNPKKNDFTHDRRDHADLQKLQSRKEVPSTFKISHGDKTEPILWIADVLAGARSDHLCGRFKEIYPLLSHRVTDIIAVEP